jgi:hypothetical protein
LLVGKRKCNNRKADLPNIKEYHSTEVRVICFLESMAFHFDKSKLQFPLERNGNGESITEGCDQ